MNKSTLYSVIKSVFTLVLLISFAACSNSASSEDDHDEEAEGFRLVMNGQTIVEQLPHQDLTGGIQLAPEEETDLITIYFLDHDGEQFHPEDDDLSLGYEITDENVVEFEQHTEDGKWHFHLHGHSEGNTTIDLMMMHGTHSDFTAEDIPVQVIAVN
ncbi:MAG: hypothetical protein WD059_05255 [Balneolaceae bacterium]